MHSTALLQFLLLGSALATPWGWPEKRQATGYPTYSPPSGPTGHPSGTGNSTASGYATGTALSPTSTGLAPSSTPASTLAPGAITSTYYTTLTSFVASQQLQSSSVGSADGQTIYSTWLSMTGYQTTTVSTLYSIITPTPTPSPSADTPAPNNAGSVPSSPPVPVLCQATKTIILTVTPPASYETLTATVGAQETLITLTHYPTKSASEPQAESSTPIYTPPVYTPPVYSPPASSSSASSSSSSGSGPALPPYPTGSSSSTVLGTATGRPPYSQTGASGTGATSYPLPTGGYGAWRHL